MGFKLSVSRKAEPINLNLSLLAGARTVLELEFVAHLFSNKEKVKKDTNIPNFLSYIIELYFLFFMASLVRLVYNKIYTL